MRLIDADKLILNLNNLYERCSDERRATLLHTIGIVMSQPTVYDAEEIEKAMGNACGIAHSCAMVCEVE